MFAIYNSIVANIALFGTLRYAEALVVADSTSRRNNLLILGLTTGLITSAISGILVSIFRTNLAKFFEVDSIDSFLFLIPLGVLLSIIFELALSLNIRRKFYNANGLSGFTMNLTARLSNILYGLLIAAKGVGLIIGDLIGRTLALVAVGYSFRNSADRFGAFRTTISFEAIRSAAQRYKAYPLYFLPSTFLVHLSSHLPIFFFQFQFGPAIVGAYALASSMLEIFNRLVPYSLAPMVLQKLNELKRDSAEVLSDRVYKLFKLLTASSLAIFGVVVLLGRPVFAFVFGTSWAQAGTFASLLAVFYAFNFVSIALLEVYNVIERQKRLLAHSIFNVIIRVLAIVVIVTFEVSAKSGLLVFSLAGALGSIAQVVGLFGLLGHKFVKVAVLQTLFFTVICLMSLWVNGLIPW